MTSFVVEIFMTYVMGLVCLSHLSCVCDVEPAPELRAVVTKTVGCTQAFDVHLYTESIAIFMTSGIYLEMKLPGSCAILSESGLSYKGKDKDKYMHRILQKYL